MDEDKKGVGGDEIETPAENPAAEVEGSETEVSDQTKSSQEQPEDALSNADFPSEPDKQKQAFYTMRKKIDDLESKLDQHDEDLDFVNLARGSSQPQSYSAPQQPVEFDESDPVTKAFLNEARTAKQEATVAKQEAAAARGQMEDFEAWQKYPNLNPKSPDKDRAFISDIRAQYVTDRMEAISLGKTPPRLVEVADKVQKRYEEIRSQAKEQGASEAKTTLAEKEAATLESKGTTIGNLAESSDRIEQLRDKVKHGDVEALTELNKLVDPYVSGLE